MSGEEFKDQDLKVGAYSSSNSHSVENVDNKSGFKKFKDSFKRQRAVLDEDHLNTLSSEQRKNYILSNQPYKQTLQKRHLQMMAIGGTLGSGLFIGLGYSLASGPGATLIGFSIVGFAIFCVMQAAAELSVSYPVSGSFATHVSRFVDPAIGFTVSSNYCLSWLISLPSELIGCSLVIQYWNSSVNPAVWVLIFFLTVVVLNLFGVRAYGESEFILSIIKVIAIIIFLIIGIVLICGGGPDSHGYIGAKYWHDPGSFGTPVFKSICGTFISAAFSFGGTELVILTAAESHSVNAISRATKQVFWRIALFYISTIVVIGCLVPYTDSRLLGGNSSEDITASPFVIALSNTGSFGTRVSNFMNAVILVAVLSVANSCVYASSRVIQSLGAAGQMPEFCAYIDKEGRPLVGILLSFIFGLLGFLVAYHDQDTVFDWLFSLCSISSFFTWGSICFSHVRFRLAMKKQNRSVNKELSFKAMLGIYGSIIGCILCFLLIVGEIYISAFPLQVGGSYAISKSERASDFFQNCLSIPLMILVWVTYRISSKTFFSRPLIKLEDIDLDTGRRYKDIDLLMQNVAEEQQAIAQKPFWYRWYRIWC
ncbi:bifunctional polyamine/amino acid permease [Saccharomycopsis crataegensis]|uniref:Bifunctional polyamine/amino acid permease n=1 Tax=Saccharomycopsis crataegensis TaxID=43959 RepID=A0AAV5QQ20_9ASCO|nr:bifunctional polyamine/amino acid permease [Saccharomycopsis crataegensis]